MSSRILKPFSLFHAISVWLLLWAGALVTSTGSGLAVPDWPLSYGMVFPPMTGGIFYEHGHRMIAGFVLLLTLGLGVLTFKLEGKLFKSLATTMLFLVLCQAGLGGMTVLYGLPKWVSITHALFAQIFFCLSVAFVTLQFFGPGEKKRIDALSASVTALFFVQLTSGAMTRHFKAALIVPDFPSIFGGFWPPYLTLPMFAHVIHRYGAVLIILAVITLSYVELQRASLPLLKWIGMLVFLLVMQILLGSLVVLLKRPVDVASAHLAIGALCLATSLVISLKKSGVVA